MAALGPTQAEPHALPVRQSLPRVHGYESDKVAVPLGVTKSLSSDTDRLEY
jgi:hypothetical protein